MIQWKWAAAFSTAAAVGVAAVYAMRRLATRPLGAYSQERAIAIGAVRKAAVLCKTAQRSVLESHGAVLKKDQSPVTVADLGAQVVITRELLRAFPADGIVGEEDTTQLDAQPELVQQVGALVESATGTRCSEVELREALSRGKHAGGAGRFWTVDPIDGTLGFLRGADGQYAVALALVVNGEVEVGVLGCPNLALDSGSSSGSSGAAKTGVLFVATRGQQTRAVPLHESDGEETVVHASTVVDAKEAVMAESLDASHSSHTDSSRIAQHLKLHYAPVRCDSQVKYGMVARGDASIYLRLPVAGRHYTEWVWDHAAGARVVESAGGMVTDSLGRKLDFTKGRQLSANTGVVATANAALHRQVLAAIQQTRTASKD